MLGAANKGVFFDGGVVIGSNGAEGELLGGSSISTNPEAVGYHISETIGMKSDNYFQARLDDNASTKTYYTNDVIKKGAKAFDLYVRNFDVSDNIRWKYSFLFSNHFENRNREENEKLKTIKQDLELATRVIYQRSREISYYI